MSKKILRYIVLIICIFLVLLFMYNCPFRSIFGLSCPGCGMSRAFLAAIRFDFDTAFSYHPLFIIGALLFLYFLLDELALLKKINKKYKKIFLYITCSLMIICWIVRLIQGDDIVRFDYRNSIVYRILSK